MTILLLGLTTCAICGDVIGEADEAYGFPAFAANENDPLIFFNDGAFHANCLRSHAQGDEAMKRVDEWLGHTGPGKRRCRVCGEQVTDPDDYLLIDHMTSDRDDDLFEYNYTHLHKSCVSRWPERPFVVELLEDLRRSGAWSGPYLEDLIASLKTGIEVD